MGFLPRGSQGGDDPGCCGAKVGPHLGVHHHDGHGGAKDSMLPYESLLDSIAVALKSVESN